MKTWISEFNHRKILLKTNLDLAHEDLPKIFFTLPQKGDLIQSRTSHSGRPDYRLTLEVVRITHRTDDWDIQEIVIELGLPLTHIPYDENGIKSLGGWYKQVYQKATGRTFI